jgi:hypothetical protein
MAQTDTHSSRIQTATKLALLLVVTDDSACRFGLGRCKATLNPVQSSTTSFATILFMAAGAQSGRVPVRLERI